MQDWLGKMMPDPEKWAGQFAAHPVTSRPIVRAAVRAAIADAFGPEVMHDALETDEARSYIAAREQADAEMEDFRREAAEQAKRIASDLSAMLPDGYRFEWK